MELQQILDLLLVIARYDRIVRATEQALAQVTDERDRAFARIAELEVS